MLETWFYGEGNKAGNERWAFAVSAKKDWKAKVKSDVKKIVDVNQACNRGYAKIFFLSNQFIPDKKRADTEDEIRVTYGIELRIFDKNWLLDKMFSKDSNKLIAVDCFALSDKFIDEKRTGTRDYSRQNEMKEIEDKLSAPTNLKRSEFVPLAQRSIVIGRELEVLEPEILGLIDRYLRLANEYGNIIDVADSIYTCAWTIYWWYTDGKKYYELYTKFEGIALPENNVNLFEKLITLWLNLIALKNDGLDIDTDQHAQKIIEKYHFLTSDENKPNTILLARSSFQRMRWFLGDDVNSIVNDYISIIKESKGYLDFDLYPTSRIIQELPVFYTADNYDTLFELVIERMGQEDKDAEIGTMLAKRGHSIKKEKPYEALKYFSRSLIMFFNDTNKVQLITAVLEIGQIFDKVGLYWAARNFYFYDFCLCMNQYMKHGEVSPVLMISANSLKIVEFRLGRILYATEFDYFEKIAKAIYPEKLPEEDDNFDYLLALQIFRTPVNKLSSIESLPGYFDSRGLIFSSIATEYELGHYNEDLLGQLDGNKDAFENFIGKWKDQPAVSELKGEPWYGFEPNAHLNTKVLGCIIDVVACNNSIALEFASTVLATIECFFGSGINSKLLSMTGKVNIEIKYEQSDIFYAKLEHSQERPTVITITISMYQQSEYLEAQEKLGNILNELLGIMTAIMFPMQEQFEKLKKITEEDDSLIRTKIFANSVFVGIETMGFGTFSFEHLVSEYEKTPLTRSYKPEIQSCENRKNEKGNEELKIHYENPSVECNFQNISHENIYAQSVINVPLWNNSSWKGVMFIAFPNNAQPPLLAPVFENKAGINIFEEWIRDFGRIDSDDQIGIRIIKGINKNHPNWYRVILGSTKLPQLPHSSEMQIVTFLTRVHTMEAENATSINMFENALKVMTCYSICPAVFKELGVNPDIIWDKAIHKNMTSIIICDACEVPNDDILFEAGILPDDNPVIPTGKEKAPIIEIINRKKKFFP